MCLQSWLSPILLYRQSGQVQVYLLNTGDHRTKYLAANLPPPVTIHLLLGASHDILSSFSFMLVFPLAVVLYRILLYMLSPVFIVICYHLFLSFPDALVYILSVLYRALPSSRPRKNLSCAINYYSLLVGGRTSPFSS